jgi:tryptophan 2,3-dioxygenase
VHCYRLVGKHFVDKAILEILSRIRRSIVDHLGPYPCTLGTTRRLKSLKILRDFLTIALDKHLGHYDYKSYIALVLLVDDTQPIDGSLSTILERRVQLLRLLLSDIAHFEASSLLGREVLTNDHQSQDAMIARLLLCKRALTEVAQLRIEGVTSSTGDLAALSDMPGSVDQCKDPQEIQRALAVADLNLHAMGWDDEAPLDLLLLCSMLPVHTNHDEYLFIRILQAAETIFNAVVHGLKSVIFQVLDNELRAATTILRDLTALFQCSFSLFRLLRTMLPSNFRAFRQYTEGASAIQSPQYKTIEVLMGRPSSTRQASAAFQFTMPIRLLYERSALNIADAFLEWSKANHHGEDLEAMNDPLALEFLQELNQFDRILLSWKRLHYTVAVTMLGTVRGTGGTDGVSYLREFKDDLLLPWIDVALSNRRARLDGRDGLAQADGWEAT